jgi:hypothetical protein
MRTANLLTFGIFSILFGVSSTTALAGPDRHAFSAALEQHYPETRYDRGHDRIKAEGPLFILGKDGLRVDPSTDIAIIYNDVADGQITDPRGGSYGARQNSVRLKTGDKIYITGIDVKEDATKIAVLTQDTFDIDMSGRPMTVHFTAILRFKYPKGYLDTVAPADLLKTVEAIIQPQSSSVPDSPPTRITREPLAPSAPELPKPPKPAVPAAPVTIAPGETIQQVTKKLGQPQQILDNGNVKIYIYPNMKITFTGGIVSDLD